MPFDQQAIERVRAARTIKEGFDSLAEVALIKRGIPVDSMQYKESQKMFYAGAAFIYKQLMRIVDEVEDSDEGGEALKAYETELGHYAAELLSDFITRPTR